MQNTDFKEPVKKFVEKLVLGDYLGVIDLSYSKERVNNPSDIEREINSYPGRITLPPESAYQEIQVYEYSDGSGYSLEFPLWFDNKRSDLEIIIDVEKVNNKLYFSLDSIHVL